MKLLLFSVVVVCFSLTLGTGPPFQGRCGVPGTPRNGNYTIDEKNSAVNYGCTSNKFRLFGAKTRKCLSDGTWDTQVPYCGPNLALTNLVDCSVDGSKGNCRPQKINETQLKSNLTLNLNVSLSVTSVFLLLNSNAPGLPDIVSIQGNKSSSNIQNCSGPNNGTDEKVWNCDTLSLESPNLYLEFNKMKDFVIGNIGIYENYSGLRDLCFEPDKPASSTIIYKNSTLVQYNCTEGLTKKAGHEVLYCYNATWNGTALVCEAVTTTSTSTSTESTASSIATIATSSHNDDGLPFSWWYLLLIVICTILALTLLGLLYAWKTKRWRFARKKSGQTILSEDSIHADVADDRVQPDNRLYDNLIPITYNSEPNYAALDLPRKVSGVEDDEPVYAEPSSALAGTRSRMQPSEVLYSTVRNPHDVYAQVTKPKKKPVEELYAKVTKKQSSQQPAAEPVYAHVVKNRRLSQQEIREEIVKLYE